jgi:hypothetical protein
MITFNSKKNFNKIRKEFKNYLEQFDKDTLDKILNLINQQDVYCGYKEFSELHISHIPPNKSLKQAVEDYLPLTLTCQHCKQQCYYQDSDFVPISYFDSGEINCLKCGNPWLFYSYDGD